MLELHVEGMTCNHCVHAVTQAVHSVVAETPVVIDLPSGTVRIDRATSADAAEITAAIVEEGYTVT
ncbi:MAG: heavy-metal-associated domain-containing protein [Acidiphilium sp.]|nr:heavy-metal-associated domain-containing protein [Acidiphilium sp.]MDD4936774.1 heavy-metal-associated domain-containing protein [Acidiphilium sp.]